MSADYLTRELVSHSRKVCSLFKRMSRDVDFWENCFYEARFKKLQLRQQFDSLKSIKDMRQAKVILQQAEDKFYHSQMHPAHKNGQPVHPYSKEGIAYERNLLSPDYVMDAYHPLEKAQYPYYYAKREEMKDEYIKMWNKKVLKGVPHEAKDQH